MSFNSQFSSCYISIYQFWQLILWVGVKYVPQLLTTIVGVTNIFCNEFYGVGITEWAGNIYISFIS